MARGTTAAAARARWTTASELAGRELGGLSSLASDLASLGARRPRICGGSRGGCPFLRPNCGDAVPGRGGVRRREPHRAASKKW